MNGQTLQVETGGVAMRFAYSADSHVGNVRGHNEDSAFAGPHLLLVADGVGGQPAGEVASASVAFVLSALSMRPGAAEPDQALDISPNARDATHEPDLLGRLRDSVEFAFRHLGDGVAADSSRRGMATTLTAILTDGRRFGLAHLGDSRAYLLRAGRLSRLTTDHTFGQSMIDQGLLTPDQADDVPYRSALTRYLTGGEFHEPDLTYLDLRPGDRVLVCSDGLTGMVASEEEIAAMLTGAPRERAVESLVAAALREGGRDNITCVVGDVDAQDFLPWSRRPYYCRMCGAVADLENLIDPAAVACAAA
jgi:PPM family protein phosphatase